MIEQVQGDASFYLCVRNKGTVHSNPDPNGYSCKLDDIINVLVIFNNFAKI